LYLRRRARLWRSTALFVCDSEFIKRKAVAQGFPEHKLIVHYIGVDRTKFKKLTPKRERALILFVGRLVEKKGCEYLIRAMRTISFHCAQPELVVIGDGPLRSQLERLAGELSVKCRFLGAQTNEVTCEWMQRATVFCAPSVTARNGDSEGLGIVFAEAQAAGTPVVSFDHGGIPEVVRHQDTGLLAPERDEQTLAKYLLRFLNDDVFWNACSQRSITWIADRFDLKVQTERLESLFERVLDEDRDHGLHTRLMPRDHEVTAVRG
jgi:glycosyltransferase involved in cell wall biosynthesis